MTPDELKLLISGFLGVIFHSLLRLQSLKTDAKKANVRLKFKEWLAFDWVPIAMSFTSVFIWYYVFKEVVAKYPQLQEFTRISFVTMGAIGSMIIQMALSNAKSWIRKVIDEKTNIADEKTEDKLAEDR